jgi:hypothetical protein
MLFGGWDLISGDVPPMALFGKGARVPLICYRVISYCFADHIPGWISIRFGKPNGIFSTRSY